MFRSSNPILNRDEAFAPRGGGGPAQQTRSSQPQQAGYSDPYGSYGPATTQQGGRMTIEDVLTKTLLVMGTMIAVAAAVMIFVAPQAAALPMIVGGLGALGISLVVAFRRSVGPVLAMVFGVLEGLLVGGFSLLFESVYPGIVTQAVLATFAVAGTVLVLYRFRVIRVTSKFRKVLLVALPAFLVAILLNFVLSLFGVNEGAGLGLRAGVTGEVGWLPWAVSLLAVVLASMTLAADFDLIENGVRNGAPASHSWMAAFGLTASMVWLYVEILRIISYFRR